MRIVGWGACHIRKVFKKLTLGQFDKFDERVLVVYSPDYTRVPRLYVVSYQGGLMTVPPPQRPWPLEFGLVS